MNCGHNGRNDDRNSHNNDCNDDRNSHNNHFIPYAMFKKITFATVIICIVVSATPQLQ